MPFIQEMVRVDLRIQVIEIPSQDVISHDNVSMKVDAVLYFNVVNPERPTIQVQHYLPATNMLAQTTLRAVLGRHELDEMLSEHVTTPRIALVPLVPARRHTRVLYAQQPLRVAASNHLRDALGTLTEVRSGRTFAVRARCQKAGILPNPVVHAFSR
jgi:hypothetical protein